MLSTSIILMLSTGNYSISSWLICAYYTYMDRDTGAHFVLFDDGDTMLRKVEVARRAGITLFLAPYQDIRDCAGALGLLPRSMQKRGPRAVDAVPAGE